MDYPVRLIANGEWLEGSIKVIHEELPPLPPDLVEKVEAIWMEELERNPNLTNGQLLTARRIETRNNGARLQLTCGISDYKRFMGTTHESVAPHISEEYIHRATGFLAITITDDNYLLLGIRSPKIDYGLLRHAVPAGRLRPEEKNPFSGIRKEFKEELGVEENEINSLICLGVIADETYGRLNNEFCFVARIGLTAREVITRAQTAKSASEHCQIEMLPWRPFTRFMEDILEAEPDSFVPTGWAGLALAYWETHLNEGEQWTPVHRTYRQHMGRRLDMLIKK